MSAPLAVLLLASWFAAPSSAQTAGDFDSYTFTLEWTPAFCEGKPGIPECANAGPGRFDAGHLALHGLWPDKSGDASHSYVYCGVDPSVKALDRAPTWCRLPPVELSAGARSRLGALMPGVVSCLDRHEWTKHGTCSGMAPDDYFTAAENLVDRVNATRFGRYLAANVGQNVDAEDLLAAFEADFGAGARRFVTLTCTFARGSDMLLDVRLRLSQPLGPADQLGSMLRERADRGNCPRTFLIDLFGG